MRPRLRIWTAAGALSLLAAPALAQQPVVEDLTARSGSGSFYDQTAAREPAGGNLELFNELQRNQEQLRQLRGQVEELRYQLDRLKRQTRQQYMDLDERLSANAGAASAAGGAGAAAAEQVANGGNAGEPSASSTGQAAGASGSADNDAGARADYQAAFAKVQAREFDAATQAFEAFVDQYPNAGLTANAYYWLGELHSAGGDLEAAGASFQRVLDDFSDSNKVPDTLYKLGLLKARQGEPEASQALLERVQQEYPDSSAANLAADFQRQSGN
ncbi:MULTISPECIES: tol-pal system protein YbgF [unclassified Halomonas]|uniref:tol-pal system protein YbgF n=1 Tax=unclassified Halomonas TaxID=2609666 RepID=UPI001269078B|nr:tol-pal system protein YbgF [Halomonas sp. THAF12]QFT85066.1 tol-pal system protein YbgF [Halomonas sp. THAF12]